MEQICPNWLELPSEIWVIIFQYLDVGSHCSLERVCKEFRELGDSDFLWENQCKRTFTEHSSWYPSKKEEGNELNEAKDSVKNSPGESKNVTEVIVGWNEQGYGILDQDEEDDRPDPTEFLPNSHPMNQTRAPEPNSSWRNVFRRLIDFRIQGDFFYWVKMSNNILPSVIKYRVNMFQMDDAIPESITNPLERKLLPSYIVGEGRAPWGMCDLMGVKLGNYMSLIYNYYHHDFLIVGLYEFTPENIASVVWTSDWNNNSGASVVSERNLVGDKLWELLNPLIDAESERQSLIKQLFGTWTFEMRDIDGDKDQITVTFAKCFEHSGGGFSGKLEEDISGSMRSKFIGMISDRMISFGMNSLTQSGEIRRIAMIGQIDGDKIEGNFVCNPSLMNEGIESLIVGYFRAVKSKSNSE